MDDWIRLFNAKSEEDLAMIGRKGQGIGEAIEALRELNPGKKLRYYFELRQKAKRDRWAQDELRAQILKQRDLDVLSRWLKLAARSRTVEEFEYAVAEVQNPPACH